MGKQRMMFAAAWALCVLMYCVPVTGQAVTTWGRSFHTAVTKQADTVAELIFVTGDASEVKILASLNGAFQKYTINVQGNKPAKFEIPAAHLATQSTATDWKVEDKGIAITSPAKIGVRLVTRSTSNTGTGATTVLPDDACGNEYRLATGSTKSGSGPDEILIFPASDNGAFVTWDWNTYDLTGLMVDGAAATAMKQTVELKENEVLHLFCGISCYKLWVTSDQPIAVIAGKENNRLTSGDTMAGRTLMQNIPSIYAGTEFVAFGEDTVEYAAKTFLLDAMNAVPGTTGTKCTFRATSQSLCDDDDQLIINTDDLYIVTTNPVVMYGSFRGHGLIRPASLNVPNVNQYTTVQSIYLEEGFRYLILVTGTSIAGISVHVADNFNIGFTGVTLCMDPAYAARTRKVSLQGTNPTQYEVYANSVDFEVVNDDPTNTEEGGMVTFKANEVNEPFLVVVVEINSFDGANAALAFGVKFVPTFDAVTCVKTVATMSPGDGKDNDCDGRVDEEIANGEDDDDDGVADEDLANGFQIRSACLLEDVENAARTPSYCSIPKGDTVTYACKPGTNHGGGDLVRTCSTSDAVLSGTKPSCSVFSLKKVLFGNLGTSRT